MGDDPRPICLEALALWLLQTKGAYGEEMELRGGERDNTMAWKGAGAGRKMCGLVESSCSRSGSGSGSRYKRGLGGNRMYQTGSRASASVGALEGGVRGAGQGGAGQGGAGQGGAGGARDSLPP